MDTLDQVIARALDKEARELTKRLDVLREERAFLAARELEVQSELISLNMRLNNLDSDAALLQALITEVKAEPSVRTRR